MEISYQYKIEYNINHTRQRYKIKRRLGVSQPAQNTAYDVISYYKQYPGRTYKDVTFRIRHRLYRRMHQLCYPTMKKHHDQSKQHPDYWKQPYGRTDGESYFLVILCSGSYGNQNGCSCRNAKNNPSDCLHHLTADGHSRHTCRIIVLSYHKKVSPAIKCLKHIGNQKRNRKLQ